MTATRTSPWRVLLVQSSMGPVDHFVWIDEALASQGIECERVTPGQIPPAAIDESVRAVVVADVLSGACRRAIGAGRRAGVPTILLMDGVVEWRNTFLNWRVGPEFLRPAPVDVVACAGEVDRRILAAMGNHAVATGLPRLGQAVQAHGLDKNQILPRAAASGNRGKDATILVATAKRPAFNEAERRRLLEVLRWIRGAASPLGIELRWRLTDGLAADLEVENDDSSSPAEALEHSAALITTASTFALEGMLARRPTMIIHPHACPCWQQAAWLWRSTSGSDVAGDEASLRRMMTRLINPTQRDLHRQEQILAKSHRVEQPAEALANLIVELMANGARRSGARIAAAHDALRTTIRFAPRPVAAKDESSSAGARGATIPRYRPVVVSCVHCHGSPVGGVTTWSRRMSAASANEDRRYDVRTLLIADDASFLPDWLMEEVRASACVFDPTADHVEIVASIRTGIEELEPTIVMPNYLDACYAAAEQVRSAHGARLIAVAHSDDAYYQHLINAYGEWDAAVGVSRACMNWLGRMEGKRRPIELIPYGVAATPSPRRVEKTGPIRIAYIGRMVQHQKRIFDLLDVIDALEEHRVDYEWHMVGDGANLEEWRRRSAARMEDRGRSSIGRIVIHGRREPGWVERFLPRMDVTVLASEFEGTSITMLESMGAGVVPVVTAVASGVDEWVCDGENGFVVPIGDIDSMADRIARLANDRSLVARLGRAAWRTIRDGGATIDGMAERYESLFDEVMSRPVRCRPTDMGLRLCDSALAGPWRKECVDDAAGAAQRVEATLREAGYERVVHWPMEAIDSIGSGEGETTAIVVHVESLLRGIDDDDAVERLIDDVAASVKRWRLGGRGVVMFPHLLESVVAPGAPALRLALGRAARRGAKRIAIYGAGQHTIRASSVFREGFPIVGVIDDGVSPTGGGAERFGVPACPLNEAMEYLRPDAIVLSSDVFEAQMWRKCEELRRSGVPVLALYGRYGEETVERASAGQVAAPPHTGDRSIAALAEVVSLP